MKKLLVFQHVPHEDLGTLDVLLRRAGFQVDTVRFWRDPDSRPNLNGCDGLVILGGPMGVYEDDKYPFIKPELKLIEDALKKRVPLLGICLGSQLIAKAAGSRVYKGNAKEIGWHDVSLTEDADNDWLFLGFPDRFRAFHWHGDTFDVPQGALMLASSDLFPNQVIKVGPAAYGIQFHLEVTEQMIREWITVNEDELASLKGVVDPKAIIEETPERIEALNRLGSALGARFSRMVEK